MDMTRHPDNTSHVWSLSNAVFVPVTEVFSVEPPHLDLAYLELQDPGHVKKSGDIFDDVKFFRKSYR